MASLATPIGSPSLLIGQREHRSLLRISKTNGIWLSGWSWKLLASLIWDKHVCWFNIWDSGGYTCFMWKMFWRIGLTISAKKGVGGILVVNKIEGPMAPGQFRVFLTFSVWWVYVTFNWGIKLGHELNHLDTAVTAKSLGLKNQLASRDLITFLGTWMKFPTWDGEFKSKHVWGLH